MYAVKIAYGHGAAPGQSAGRKRKDTGVCGDMHEAAIRARSRVEGEGARRETAASGSVDSVVPFSRARQYTEYPKERNRKDVNARQKKEF
jgi:hypothetical protein